MIDLHDLHLDLDCAALRKIQKISTLILEQALRLVWQSSPQWGGQSARRTNTPNRAPNSLRNDRYFARTSMYQNRNCISNLSSDAPSSDTILLSVEFLLQGQE